MLRSSLCFVTLSAILAENLIFGAQLYGRDSTETLQTSYDYVVVGCGISGLVVANRLSEDTFVSVLCIEAGIADNYEAFIQDPVYVGDDIGGVYDWHLTTTPQTQLDGATRPIPQGKVLGGGSILNAMCWNRGGRDDYDAWEALGNPGWNWEGLLPYFIKSETYTPVSEDIAKQYSINYNLAVHGTSGPVQVSYPKYFYPQSINLFAGLNALGIPTEFDPNDGTSAGAAFVPTDIDPTNQTRSDARRTYFDPIRQRKNFHVITGQHVTRLLIENVSATPDISNLAPGSNENGDGSSSGNSNGFGFGPGDSTPPLEGQQNVPRGDSGLRIKGVEFAANASASRQTVLATREVIVAAGALHSVQLLQLSGIGSASLLKSLDIPVAVDLPGVGNNLQDHCLVGTFYPYNNNSYPSPTELTTNATYNAEAEQEYKLHKTGPWTAGSPNALAFPPLPLISNRSSIILNNAESQNPTKYLIPGLDPSIVAGYKLQKQSLVQRLAQKTVAAYEIINNNAGSLTVSVMHPFSRGTCAIRSPDPFEPPVIDPRWLSNPVDRQILIEALLFNRRLLATPPMLLLQAAQFVPPIEANEDALNQIIDNGIRTEFHPSGTCAMLPLEQGGVVDSHLRVWGTQNLRVVDASIFPLVPAAHLQAVVYGVAEKAADIIKADNIAMIPNRIELPPLYSSLLTQSNPSPFVFTSLSSSTIAKANDTVPTTSLSTSYVPVPSSRSTKGSALFSTFTGATYPVSNLAALTTSKKKQETFSSALALPSSEISSTMSKSLISPLSDTLTFIEVPSTPATTTLLEITTSPVTNSIETTASPSLSHLPPIPEQPLFTPIAEILNSVGIPSLAVSSLILNPEGAIFTSAVVSTALQASPSTTGLQADQYSQQQWEKQRLAISNFINWLLSFFNASQARAS